jgi:Zn-dependent peptidase ImmA (M78 family)
MLNNRDLTGAAMDEDESAAGLRGRWRATLAHEGSHVVMHRFLFELDGDGGHLFGERSETRTSPRLMRCLKPNVLFRDSATDWREFQANRGMAALLMPRTVFNQIVAEAITRLALGAEDLVLGSWAARGLAAEIAPLLGVSKQAAGIRLETLGFLGSPGQARLHLA